MINWSNPITKGIATYCPFSEGGGTIAKVFGINPNNGILDNNLGWAKTSAGYAANYTGQTSHVVDMGNDPSLMTVNVTFFFDFIRKTTATQFEELLKKDTPYILDFTGNPNAFEFAINNGSGYQSLFASGNPQFLAGNRYQLLCINDATAGRQIWINGALNTSTSYLAPGINTSSEMWLGNQSSGDINSPDINLITFGMWNRGLLPGEIRSLYTNPGQLYIKPGMLKSLNSVAAAAARAATFKTLLGAGNI